MRFTFIFNSKIPVSVSPKFLQFFFSFFTPLPPSPLPVNQTHQDAHGTFLSPCLPISPQHTFKLFDLWVIDYWNT